MNVDPEDRSSSVTDIRIEVTDDELKELSHYFLKSKDEIQKKVDSLLSLDIPTKIVPVKPIKSETPTPRNKFDNNPVGKPIDLETAKMLREMTIGSCVHAFSNDWRRAKFVFRDENSELSYGLLSEKNGSKGLILSVQTVLLKNLIDRGYTDIHGKTIQDSEWRNKRKILQPNETERKDALIKSIIDILWRAGEMSYACVVLNSLSNCFDVSSDYGYKSKSNYYADGFTERLHLYEFTDFKLLENFVRKNLIIFQKEDGCLTFLYSLVLSRKADRLINDLQGHTLLGDMEDCRIPLFTLILTGFATPFLHNGSTYYDSEGESLTTPLVGVKNRSDIGILYWDPKEEDDKRTEVASMLKTPRYPIWLLIMGKNLLAILFHTNLELINNWRFEIAFTLNFYSPLKKQEEKFEICIENRDFGEQIQDQSNVKKKFANIFKFIDEDKDPEIISIIKTKWPDCEITNTDGKDIMALL